jgi:N-methylhydantoinase A
LWTASVWDFHALPENRVVAGPAIIESSFTSIVVDAGARAVRDRFGTLVIDLGA